MKNILYILLVIVSLQSCKNSTPTHKAIKEVESEFKINFTTKPNERYGKKMDNSFIYSLTLPFGTAVEVKDKIKNKLSKNLKLSPTESKELQHSEYISIGNLYDHYEWKTTDYEITFEITYYHTDSAELRVWEEYF